MPDNTEWNSSPPTATTHWTHLVLLGFPSWASFSRKWTKSCCFNPQGLNIAARVHRLGSSLAMRMECQPNCQTFMGVLEPGRKRLVTKRHLCFDFANFDDASPKYKPTFEYKPSGSSGWCAQAAALCSDGLNMIVNGIPGGTAKVRSINSWRLTYTSILAQLSLSGEHLFVHWTSRNIAFGRMTNYKLKKTNLPLRDFIFLARHERRLAVDSLVNKLLCLDEKWPSFLEMYISARRHSLPCTLWETMASPKSAANFYPIR